MNNYKFFLLIFLLSNNLSILKSADHQDPNQDPDFFNISEDAARRYIWENEQIGTEPQPPREGFFQTLRGLPRNLIAIPGAIADFGRLAQTARNSTLPEIERTTTSVRTTLDQTNINEILREIQRIRLDTLNETRQLREIANRFLLALAQIPRFTKSLIIMILGGSTTYLSSRYITLAGILQLIQAYSRIKPRPELKQNGWLQTSTGIGVAIIGIIAIAYGWYTYNKPDEPEPAPLPIMPRQPGQVD